MDRRKSGTNSILHFHFLNQSLHCLSHKSISPFIAGGDTLGDPPLRADIKATDDILISEYWLTDLVSWDNAIFHRVTLLGWRKAAYFRHRESSIKLYPNHRLTEGASGKQELNGGTSKTMLYFKGTSVHFLCSKPWKNMIGRGLCFTVMKWYWSKGGGLKTK